MGAAMAFTHTTMLQLRLVANARARVEARKHTLQCTWHRIQAQPEALEHSLKQHSSALVEFPLVQNNAQNAVV